MRHSLTTTVFPRERQQHGLSALTLLVPLLMTLGVGNALAHDFDDHEVLITHGIVMAEGGFPYRITKPGNYRLGGNLNGPLNTGVILIESSNVTLDLAGFNVSCHARAVSDIACISDTGPGAIAPAAPYTGITVQNGSVTVSATNGTGLASIVGLWLLESQSSTVERIRFNAGVLQGFGANGLVAGTYSIIRYNTFNNVDPDINCPSLVEGNVNQSSGAGSSGAKCVGVNNVGLFSLM